MAKFYVILVIYQCKTIFRTFFWAILHTTRLAWGLQRCRNSPTRPKPSGDLLALLVGYKFDVASLAIGPTLSSWRGLEGRGSHRFFYLKNECTISRTSLTKR